MKRDEDPVPQFTSAGGRAWLKRKGRKGSASWVDGLSWVDVSGLFELLAKLLAGLFEHHH